MQADTKQNLLGAQQSKKVERSSAPSLFSCQKSFAQKAQQSVFDFYTGVFQFTQVDFIMYVLLTGISW